MLTNLKSAMWERHISGRKIADLLKIRPETVSDKILGKTDFTRAEMFLIHDTFFKDIDMAYLFREKAK